MKCSTAGLVEMAEQLGVPMVMRCDTETVLAYELFDREGHALGRILMPRDEVLVGPQAGTVLLRREMPSLYSRFNRDGKPPARAA